MHGLVILHTWRIGVVCVVLATALSSATLGHGVAATCLAAFLENSVANTTHADTANTGARE